MACSSVGRSGTKLKKKKKKLEALSGPEKKERGETVYYHRSTEGRGEDYHQLKGRVGRF